MTLASVPSVAALAALIGSWKVAQESFTHPQRILPIRIRNLDVLKHILREDLNRTVIGRFVDHGGVS